MGILLGVLPGTGAAVAGVLALWLRLNLPLMVGGALFTNPVTAPFLYICSYAVGSRLLADHLPSGLLARIVVGTFAGNLVLAFLLSIVGYLTAFLLITFLRLRRLKLE